MILILLSLVSCFLFLWVYIRWSRVKNFWAKRGVPHNPPHPLMGSLTFLQRQNPTIWMRKLYRDFKGPYVGVWLFWRPGLVINNPEIARRVLVKDADNFRNRFLSSGKTDPTGSLNLFTTNTIWMRKLYRDFKGPYVGVWLFWRPGLVINNPEIARRVLVKDADNFRNRFLSSGKTDPTGSLNLFTTNTIWMRKLYRDFKGPYVGVWLFWRPGLVINNPEIARRVLVKDADNFRNRFLSSGKTDPTGSLNLFTTNDPIWTKLRRRLTPVFTASKLKSQSQMTQIKANDLVQRLKEEITKKKSIHLRNTFTDYTTDVIGESAFGVTSESAKTGDSIMRKVTRDIMAFNLHRGLCWSSIFFFPELVDIFRFSLFPKDTMELLRKIYRSIVEQRGGYDKQVKEPRDLFDALLKIRQEALAENEEMTEDILLAQAAIFLLGGFETSGAAMTWAIYELAWNPQQQQRLYEELLDAKQRFGNKMYEFTHLSELNYLTGVIKETLRIYPPMGWLDRIAAKDYKIDDNLTIPAGTVIYVNAAGIQIDEQYFPEPMTFNPDRFLPENAHNIQPYTFMPFGEGPRSCIGMRFGYQTVRQGLAPIILNYEVRTLPNSPKPTEIQAEKQGMLYMPLDDRMLVEFVPRENA